MGQRRVGQEVGATGRQVPVVQEGVEQLARSTGYRQQSIELRETALFDVCLAGVPFGVP